jgi:chemotaxis response regulator CheB
MSAEPTRIIAVDDMALFRASIAELIDAQEDFAVVAEAGNGLEAVEKANALKPDLVVMERPG